MLNKVSLRKNYKSLQYRNVVYDLRNTTPQLWTSISDLDPDSNRSVDPDPKGVKMTHKNRNKLRNFMFWRAGSSLLRAEGFSCSLDVLYGGLGG